jgi:hypothetical protein
VRRRISAASRADVASVSFAMPSCPFIPPDGNNVGFSSWLYLVAHEVLRDWHVWCGFSVEADCNILAWWIPAIF